MTITEQQYATAYHSLRIKELAPKPKPRANNYPVNDTERKIIAYLATVREATTCDIRTATGLDLTDIQVQLNRMRRRRDSPPVACARMEGVTLWRLAHVH
jgi:hypothetical protein